MMLMGGDVRLSKMLGKGHQEAQRSSSCKTTLYLHVSLRGGGGGGGGREGDLNC